MVDQAHPDGPLVALAAPYEVVTVEALDTDGTVVASCPPDGVVVDEKYHFPCTLAPGVKPVVTTNITVAP